MYRYIHMLGVSPEHQGKGVGRLLMRIVCALADQDALPVHLEVCLPVFVNSDMCVCIHTYIHMHAYVWTLDRLLLSS